MVSVFSVYHGLTDKTTKYFYLFWEDPFRKGGDANTLKVGTEKFKYSC